MSPFSATLRRSGASIPRSSQKAARRAATAAGRLPPEKLRALISLYHQSDTFITEDNLLERINEALIKTSSSLNATPTVFQPGIRSLQEILERRQSTPKTSVDWSDGRTEQNIGGVWSYGRSPRERDVVGALYGVDSTLPTEVKLGLEILQEAEGSNQEPNAAQTTGKS